MFHWPAYVSCGLASGFVSLPAMTINLSPPESGKKKISAVKRAYKYLARRACSTILLGALICTLLVKLFHAIRQDCLGSYSGWVLSDIAVILAIESILALVCFVWPKRWVIRAPSLVTPGTRITTPTSSIDLTPTILTLMGYDISAGNFDGLNALDRLPDNRSIYFSGWIAESPVGFIKASKKYIYYPSAKTIRLYDLGNDPLEQAGIAIDKKQAKAITEDILNWRTSSIFEINQQLAGEITIFQNWLCRWEQRVPKKCSRI